MCTSVWVTILLKKQINVLGADRGSIQQNTYDASRGKDSVRGYGKSSRQHCLGPQIISGCWEGAGGGLEAGSNLEGDPCGW